MKWKNGNLNVFNWVKYYIIKLNKNLNLKLKKNQKKNWMKIIKLKTKMR